MFLLLVTLFHQWKLPIPCSLASLLTYMHASLSRAWQQKLTAEVGQVCHFRPREKWFQLYALRGKTWKYTRSLIAKAPEELCKRKSTFLLGWAFAVKLQGCIAWKFLKSSTNRIVNALGFQNFVSLFFLVTFCTVPKKKPFATRRETKKTHKFHLGVAWTQKTWWRRDPITCSIRPQGVGSGKLTAGSPENRGPLGRGEFLGGGKCGKGMSYKHPKLLIPT